MIKISDKSLASLRLVGDKPRCGIGSIFLPGIDCKRSPRKRKRKKVAIPVFTSADKI